MPPKVKKASLKKPKVSLDLIIEKENKSPDPVQKRRNVRKIKAVQYKETDIEDLSDSISAQEKSNAELKPLGFWSKKLKDLEENLKNKKYGLYEFNTDESESSYNRKKRAKPRSRIKKQPAIPKPFKLIEKKDKIPRPAMKKNKMHEHSLWREQIILSKERQKLADKGEKFTFSTGISSLGITSTPAVNKDNLVGASNFLFLSPVNKEEIEQCCMNVENEPAFNNKDASGQETPKMETKLKRISCRRVLRSGKMLNT